MLADGKPCQWCGAVALSSDNRCPDRPWWDKLAAWFVEAMGR